MSPLWSVCLSEASDTAEITGRGRLRHFTRSPLQAVPTNRGGSRKHPLAKLGTVEVLGVGTGALHEIVLDVPQHENPLRHFLGQRQVPQDREKDRVGKLFGADPCNESSRTSRLVETSQKEQWRKTEPPLRRNAPPPQVGHKARMLEKRNPVTAGQVTRKMIDRATF